MQFIEGVCSTNLEMLPRWTIAVCVWLLLVVPKQPTETTALVTHSRNVQPALTTRRLSRRNKSHLLGNLCVSGHGGRVINHYLHVKRL